jgi:CHAD domain-containing protein
MAMQMPMSLWKWQIAIVFSKESIQPERQRMSFDDGRIQDSTRKVRKFLQKNSKNPSSKSVHGLRTNTRRLATMILTFGLDSKGRIKRLLGNLEEIRKRAGKIRDMDVLTADAMSIRLEGEEDCQVRLLEHLGADREKYGKKLRREIQKTSPQLRQDVKYAAKRAKTLIEQAIGDSASSNTIPLTMAKIIKLSSDLNRPARLNRKNLHPYRLRVKELLNVLQLSNHPADPSFLKKLEEVKYAIGKWHDWEQLIAVARDLSNHAATCKLIKSLETTRNSKYERAMSLTNHLRTDYLGRVRTSKDLRSKEVDGASLA